jgi:hypothetical protein
LLPPAHISAGFTICVAIGADQAILLFEEAQRLIRGPPPPAGLAEAQVRNIRPSPTATGSMKRSAAWPLHKA